MRYGIIVLLLLVTYSGFGQKVNFTAAVNNPGYSSKNIAGLGPATTVPVDYSTFGIGLGCGIVAVNIKRSFDDVRDNMVQFVAKNYLSGGNPDSRYRMATDIIAQILRLNDKIIINQQDVTYLRTYQFAQDLLLFRTIYYEQTASVYVQDSPDSEIPLRIITNHPLLLVNGQKRPAVISNTKSILIK